MRKEKADQRPKMHCCLILGHRGWNVMYMLHIDKMGWSLSLLTLLKRFMIKKMSNFIKAFSHKWLIMDLGSRIKEAMKTKVESSQEFFKMKFKTLVDEQEIVINLIFRLRISKSNGGFLKIDRKYFEVRPEVECDDKFEVNVETFVQQAQFGIIRRTYGNNFPVSCLILHEPAWGNVGFVDADSVTIRCVATVHKKAASNDLRSDFHANLETMRQDSNLSDVAFICNEDQFIPAFSNILMAHSKVFKCMLTNKMAEKQSKIIFIKDISFKVVEAFVKVMHQGDLNGIEHDLIMDLIVLADRYEVKQVLILCEQNLVENFDVANLLEYLLLGEKCQCQVLRSECIKYIANHIYVNFRKSEMHKMLQPEFPKLVEDIEKAIVKKILEA